MGEAPTSRQAQLRALEQQQQRSPSRAAYEAHPQPALRLGEPRAGCFTVRHFAQRAEYQLDGFCAPRLLRRADAVADELALHSTPRAVCAVLGAAASGADALVEPPAMGSGSADGAAPEAGGVGERFYVACLNPNRRQQPGEWDAAAVCQQLRAHALVEVAQFEAQRARFGIEVAHEVLLAKYGAVPRALGVAPAAEATPAGAASQGDAAAEAPSGAAAVDGDAPGALGARPPPLFPPPRCVPECVSPAFMRAKCACRRQSAHRVMWFLKVKAQPGSRLNHRRRALVRPLAPCCRPRHAGRAPCAAASARRPPRPRGRTRTRSALPSEGASAACSRPCSCRCARRRPRPVLLLAETVQTPILKIVQQTAKTPTLDSSRFFHGGAIF